MKNKASISLEKKYFTIAEIAEILRLNKRTIWNWIKAKDLKAIKIKGKYLRIPHSQLNKLIKRVGQAKSEVCLLQDGFKRMDVRMYADEKTHEKIKVLASIRKVKIANMLDEIVNYYIQSNNYSFPAQKFRTVVRILKGGRK